MCDRQLTLCPYIKPVNNQLECKIFAPRRKSCICAYYQDDGQCNMSVEKPEPNEEIKEKMNKILSGVFRKDVLAELNQLDGLFSSGYITKGYIMLGKLIQKIEALND